MKTERLTLVLSSAEMQALRKSSKIDLRHPKEQARYILQSVLLGGQSQEMTKPVTASNLAERTANGFVTGNPS